MQTGTPLVRSCLPPTFLSFATFIPVYTVYTVYTHRQTDRQESKEGSIHAAGRHPERVYFVHNIDSSLHHLHHLHHFFPKKKKKRKMKYKYYLPEKKELKKWCRWCRWCRWPPSLSNSLSLAWPTQQAHSRFSCVAHPTSTFLSLSLPLSLSLSLSLSLIFLYAPQSPSHSKVQLVKKVDVIQRRKWRRRIRLIRMSR